MIAATLTCGLLSGMAMQGEGMDERARLVEWFQARAKPIATTDPAAAGKDLACLRKMVGEARIVGLGEATHGTRDFFRLKHRIVRYLVEEMEFTHFGFEGGFAECRAIDRYILTGKGSPTKALADLGIWVWNTEEVLDLIHWMRRHNAKPECKSPVRFFGFDMRSPAGSARQLLKYLDCVDEGFASGKWTAAKSIRAHLESATKWKMRPVSDVERAESERMVALLLARFDELAESYAERSSKEAATIARQLVVVMGQAMQVVPRQGGARPPTSARDEFMAANTSWLLKLAGHRGKVAIWAHNGHISRNGLNVLKSQGGFLHRRHGADYVAFGFSFREGGFQAMAGNRVQAFTVGPHDRDSFDGVLADAGHRRAFFDIRGTEKGATIHSWLHAKQRVRTVGAFYSDSLEAKGRGALLVEPAGAFDVWIFADQTTRARPLRAK